MVLHHCDDSQDNDDDCCSFVEEQQQPRLQLALPLVQDQHYAAAQATMNNGHHHALQPLNATVTTVPSLMSFDTMDSTMQQPAWSPTTLFSATFGGDDYCQQQQQQQQLLPFVWPPVMNTMEGVPVTSVSPPSSLLNFYHMTPSPPLSDATPTVAISRSTGKPKRHQVKAACGMFFCSVCRILNAFSLIVQRRIYSLRIDHDYATPPANPDIMINYYTHRPRVIDIYHFF
jgi:hypothetical protein